jgi:hypothetical protein
VQLKEWIEHNSDAGMESVGKRLRRKCKDNIKMDTEVYNYISKSLS